MKESFTARDLEAEREEIKLVLDDAMHGLREKDRHAILLRFFEGKSLAQVGHALDLNENAARKRVERALERLRHNLGRRGVKASASVLGGFLVSEAVTAAPAGLAACHGEWPLSRQCALLVLPGPQAHPSADRQTTGV